MLQWLKKLNFSIKLTNYKRLIVNRQKSVYSNLKPYKILTLQKKMLSSILLMNIKIKSIMKNKLHLMVLVYSTAKIKGFFK
jgi:hypothetical protein